MGNRLILLEKMVESKMAQARHHKAMCANYEPWTSEFLEEQVKLFVAVCEAKAAHRKFLSLTILAKEMQS